MPRRAGLDASGSLHYVIFRSIERRNLVDDYRDRRDIVSRMGTIALETGTAIYAWALMTNPIFFCAATQAALRSTCFGDFGRRL